MAGLLNVPAVKPVVGDVTPNSIVTEAGIESGWNKSNLWYQNSGLGISKYGIDFIGDDLMTVTVKQMMKSALR